MTKLGKPRCIGLSASEPEIENPATWRGQNLLGFALMRVRTVLDIIASDEKISVEEAFADVHGHLEFFEDPDAPTVDEWNDI